MLWAELRILAVGTVRLWWRLLPQLLGIFLLGWLGSQLAGKLAVQLGDTSAWLALITFSLTFLCQLVAIVVILQLAGRELGIRDVIPAEERVDVEVTRRQEVPDFYCGFALLGPDRRRYEPDGPSVSRPLPSSCRAEELPIGQPRRVEVFFVVPDRFLDRIYGLAVTDGGSRAPTQVLRPA